MGKARMVVDRRCVVVERPQVVQADGAGRDTGVERGGQKRVWVAVFHDLSGAVSTEPRGPVDNPGGPGSTGIQAGLD